MKKLTKRINLVSFASIDSTSPFLYSVAERGIFCVSDLSVGVTPLSGELFHIRPGCLGVSDPGDAAAFCRIGESIVDAGISVMDILDIGCGLPGVFAVA